MSKSKKHTSEKSLAELNLLLDTLDIQIWYLEDEKTYGKANKAHAEFLGLNKSEIAGKKIEEFLSKKEVEICKEGNTEVFNKKEKIKTEEWLENSDGEKRLLSITKNPKLNEQGEVECVVCSAEDITERKKTAEELQETKNHLETILDSIQDGISVLDTALNIQYTNHTIKTWYRGNRPLEDKKCYQVYHNRSAPCPDCPTLRCLESGEVKKEVLPGLEGSDVDYLEIYSYPMIAEDTDEITGVVEFVRNITELKQKEKTIENLHEIALDFKQLADKNEVCARTIEAAENLLQFDICNIALEKNELLIPQAKTDNTKNKKMALTEGIAGKTYRKQESYIIDDVHNNPEAKPVHSSYKSAISIPVGEYGVFQATAGKKGAFQKRDLKLAELLIAHTAAALERINYQEQLKYKTFHDELTGLYNRRFIQEEMQRLDTARQLPISIIMADINGLKIINDSLGHNKGDQLLKKTANLLQNVLRDEDIIARYGGDEFIVLLPQTSKKTAQDIGGRIKKCCKETKTEELTLSLGTGAATKRDPEEDMENIIKKADNNLYEDKLMNSRSIKHEIVKGLLNTLAANSSETIEHAQHMKELAQKLGTKIGLNKSQLNRLSLLAILHDIGKISISSDILTKPDKLTDKEWQLLKKHTENSHKIVSASEKFAVIAEEILYHHEHYNGDGYPEGLAGEEIPLLARIIALVDAYNVMTTGRPYQDAMSKQEVLQEIKSCAGTQFDPALTEEFVEMVSE